MLAYDGGQVDGFIADVASSYQEAGAFWDGRSAIWSAQMQYDAFSLGYTEARAKQLKELRHALGLS